MSHDQEMHVGAWRIGTFNTAAGWYGVCGRKGGDAEHFGPLRSRERARRMALFHALWCDGLLDEDVAEAMLRGDAEVVWR